MNDKVSVIMPSYNTAEYIGESIDSVLAQTYTNWELIIVDDCSTDDTDDVVASYLVDERIRYLKNEQNSGAAVSRNRALREATGRWIAFLDSDDVWLPEKLEKQIAFMEENDYTFSYTNYEEIDCTGVKTGVQVTGPQRITKKGMQRYCWPGCLTVMYDAGVVGLVQIADIKKNNDYAMWLKICQKADCHLIAECLARYRKGRAGSVSTNGVITMIYWHYRLFRGPQHNKPITALHHTLVNIAFGALKKLKYVQRT